MRRAASQPLLKHFQETDEDEGVEEAIIEDKSIVDVGPISKQITCVTLHKREPRKPCQESFSSEKYRALRQELRNRASSLRKQLKARWAIQALIDEQISLFQAHWAEGPIKLTDVAQLLMPKWIPAQEQAALFWLGDWRPSFILELLHSLAHSLWEPIGVERALAQLINDIRIEEAVIDEEVTEIQANCVLYLPFGVVKNEKNGPGPGPGPALAQIRSEFKKIHRVIVKAQNLRMKALELAVKKVLGQIDAAEFLVAFVGIQDLIHKFSVKCKARNGPVCIKNLGATSSKFNLLMAEDSFLGSTSNSHV